MQKIFKVRAVNFNIITVFDGIKCSHGYYLLFGLENRGVNSRVVVYLYVCVCISVKLLPYWHCFAAYRFISVAYTRE